VTGVAERVNGRRLLGVEATGKNLLLRFDGGVVVRSHLRMRGRWTVVPRGRPRYGRPWLVLRASETEALLWNGPVLELSGRGVSRLGPDILAAEPDLDRMAANLRREPGREIGDALLDQRHVAGIGNVWRAEALWAAGVSPWRRVGELSDDELRRTLEEAARRMRRSADGEAVRRAVYRRPVCPRCSGRIQSRGQGDANRTAYWCPTCQPATRAS